MKPDKEVEEFIGTVVNSLVMWELLGFLWNNPGITDTAQGIAKRLGRRSEDLQTSLESLAKNQVLKQWGEHSDPVYAFQPAAKWLKSLEKFMLYSNSKEGKLMIWSSLLKHGMR